MPNRRDLDFLGDILEAIRRADDYIGDMDYGTFADDTKTQDAVIHTIEIIGEATKHLSADIRGSYPEDPWWYLAAEEAPFDFPGEENCKEE
jgi:uncharacterized protein with HEPN domain